MTSKRINGEGGSGPPPSRHGTRSSYTQGCRCADCTETARLYVTARRRAAGVAPRVTGRTHGLRATYGAGCRCEPCREAERTYRREWRSRRG